MQFPSKVHPHDFEFGQSAKKAHADFGLPNGANSPSTSRFLKSHEKSPVLPEREGGGASITCCATILYACMG